MRLGPMGFGTAGLGEDCREAVTRALDVGYRHVDTAQIYDTEAAVGAALAGSDVARESVVVATKVDPASLAYDDVLASVRESAARLGVDRIDLLYPHWPLGAYDPGETLAAFDDLHDAGVVRAVGLSNFPPAAAETALATLDAPVVALQDECHPLRRRPDLRAFAADHGLTLVGYSPLARGRILDDPTLAAVARRHDTAVAAVCLAWALARDVVPIPAARGAHVAANWAATDLSLDARDLRAIEAIERTYTVTDEFEMPWE